MNGAKELLIGKIVGTHALKGVLRVYSYAQSDAVFAPGESMVLDTPRGERLRVSIKWSRPHKNVRLVCLEGVNDIERAQQLVGAGLFIEKSALPELEADTYYWQDLIGLSVVDANAGCLGRITAIFPTGSNDVYVVAPEGEKGPELLIPALASVVLGIDLARGTMQVDLPEGLLDGSETAADAER